MATLQQNVPLTNFGTTAAATLTATTAGRLLTCEVQAQQTTDITSVTDNGGNTWLKADSTLSTSQKNNEIWYCLNANSVTTVTVTAGATSVNINGAVQEWAGSAGYVLRGHNAVANASSTTPAAVVATSQAGDLVVSSLSYLEATSGTRQDTLASGTLLTANARGTSAFSSAYKANAAAGTDGCSWTFSPAVSSGATTAVFGPSANVAPTANAGPAQTNIEPFSTVTLDGSGSTDSDGTVASYTWTQTVGPAVTLSSTTAQKPTFTAPASTVGTTLTFSLVVKDNLGASSTAATVNITVLPHPWWSITMPGGTLRPIKLSRI